MKQKINSLFNQRRVDDMSQAIHKFTNKQKTSNTNTFCTTVEQAALPEVLL